MTRRAIFAGLVDIACHVVDRHLNPRFVSQAASNDVARLNPKPQTLNPKPLQRPFWVERTPQWGGYGGMLPVGRGLHSSTLHLNFSAFCGSGGAFRGCLWGAWGVISGMRGCSGYVLRQKRLKLS